MKREISLAVTLLISGGFYRAWMESILAEDEPWAIFVFMLPAIVVMLKMILYTDAGKIQKPVLTSTLQLILWGLFALFLSWTGELLLSKLFYLPVCIFYVVIHYYGEMIERLLTWGGEIFEAIF